jgi:hypothetical protein
MYLTGGHPACMMQILKEIDFAEPADWLRKEKREQEYYNRHIRRTIEEIEESIGKLLALFQILSAVRYFDFALLERLMKLEYQGRKVIEWQGSARNLEEALRRTYLITTKNGFLHDDIARRLLAIKLRKENQGLYLTVCRTARDYYEEILSRGFRWPEIPFVERLYQEMQILSLELQENQEKMPKLMAVAERLLRQFHSDPYCQALFQSFIERLEKDWDFRFTLNYLFRGDRPYDEIGPYQKLIQLVKKLEDSCAGEGENVRKTG